MTKFEQFTFNEEHLTTIKAGILLFNSEKFWECHEELEHHWLEARGDNIRLIYWAIIQVAACLYHVRNENLVGAKGLHKKSLDKLDRCEKNHIESILLDKSISWSQFKKTVRNIKLNPKLKDFNTLYRFKFRTPAKWSDE
ncbi:MAG: DUF309 domain-containing protein [Bacteriovoracaceae bacterium]|jgi:uncharacterized protein|nr:DUF309 domain-containing protein [Bacteriovoracaceae bacterium]